MYTRFDVSVRLGNCPTFLCISYLPRNFELRFMCAPCDTNARTLSTDKVGKNQQMNSKEISRRISARDPIRTERFDVRDLTEADASKEYLSWLDESKPNQFILSAGSIQTIETLRGFLRARINSDDVRFFGIFERKTKKHIGNIKYEPINLTKGFTVMGVLIGNPLYRGLGVFGEVYLATAGYLEITYGIKKIFLGVDSQNRSAIKSYEKAGFVRTNTHPLVSTSGGIVMVHALNPSADVR
jgi:ribosomal-protein-alanine N-acetyltransferase